MSVSRMVEGKANSIAAGVPNQPVRQPDRPTHAPMFCRPGEAEPNVVQGERLQEPTRRPRREASRTIAEARTVGLTMPEALDLSAEESAALFAALPELRPGSPETAERGPGR